MNPEFDDEEFFEIERLQRQQEEQRQYEEEQERLEEIDRQLARDAEMEMANENNWGDDSDEYPSIYDNPYYNEDLDMDQQSPDFWDSL
jgi:hypothetical protein